jgi:hypothetical protein
LSYQASIDPPCRSGAVTTGSVFERGEYLKSEIAWWTLASYAVFVSPNCEISDLSAGFVLFQNSFRFSAVMRLMVQSPPVLDGARV